MSLSTKPRISLVAAIAANGVIGTANTLPWRLPEDLKRFKKLTLGRPVIMGRKTYESIGRPLPDRHNIIVTRNASYHAQGCTIASSLNAALDACGLAHDEIFIIGGAQIYREAMPLAQRLYLTEIRREYAGDARFPDIRQGEWEETAREIHRTEDGLEFDFAVYDRI